MKLESVKTIILTTGLLTCLVACSRETESMDLNSLQGNLEREQLGFFSLREPEEIAIYTGSLNWKGRETKTTLTLISPDQYTLEQVSPREDGSTELWATTGTYSFIEIDNPRNPSLVLDILVLSRDDEKEPISFLFQEDDSFLLIEDEETYTGEEENILKREGLVF
jgi:hypothetical protein